MLQVQKLVELEEIAGTEVKAGEEPECETIVGSGRSPWDLQVWILCLFQIHFSLFLEVSGQQQPFGSPFILGALWPLGEPEEDKGDTEEPEVSTREQPEFGWAYTWMEEGGAPTLAEDKAQGLLAQVFVLSRPFPSILF